MGLIKKLLAGHGFSGRIPKTSTATASPLPPEQPHAENEGRV